MNDEYTNQSQTDPGDETPNSLMGSFKGPGLGAIIVFTLVIHVIILGGSSVPYVLRMAAAQESKELSEDERIEAAVKEATPVLREIAEKHNLNPQQLSSQFAGGASRTTKTAKNAAKEDDGSQPGATTTPDTPEDGDPEKPKSAIEKEFDVELDGPKQPNLDEEEDIFK